jgi:tetratricopeptide (TPR) repeat protein
MNNFRIRPSTKQLKPLRLDWFLRFAGYVILGFSFAVITALLLSQGKLANSTRDQLELFGSGWYVLRSPYSILVFAGSLGGLMCSFLLEDDMMLEYPAWTNDGRGLKFGFLGDLLVGIGGALIAYIVLPSALLVAPNSTTLVDATVTIFVAGLIGGYGGEYVMKAALQRLVKRIDEAEISQEKLKQFERLDDLRSLAMLQIEAGLSPEKLASFRQKLHQVATDLAPMNQDVIKEIFNAAIDTRRVGTRVKAYAETINRTIPILEELCDAQPSNHVWLAQLGASYRDALPARLDEAISCFDQAVALRDQDPDRTNAWRYEFDRVVALIQQVQSHPSGSSVGSQGLNRRIEDDLRSIQALYGLDRVFEEFDAARIDGIQAWLQDRPSLAKQLLPMLRTVAADKPSSQQASQPTTPVASVALGARPLRSSSTVTKPQLPAVLPSTSTAPPPLPADRWDRALEKARLITKGASSITARQDGLPMAGVKASEAMAETDWNRIQSFIDRIYIAASTFDVPPAIIAALASRESRAGAQLARDGTGDGGQAFGILQVDRRSWTQAGSSGDPASQEHINQGTQIFAGSRRSVQQQHPSWSDEYLLQGAAVGYNSSPANVQTIAGIDRGTTGGDYGSDVIARACFYAKRMKSLALCKAESAGAGLVESSQQASIVSGSGATSFVQVSSRRPSSPDLQRITALRDTVLKKRPVESLLLTEQEKRPVAAGQSFAVSAHRDAGSGHFQVTLVDDGSEWFIYDADRDGHWNTSWEGPEADPIASPAPTQATGLIIQTPGDIDWGKDDLRISKFFTVGEVTKSDQRRRPKPKSQEEIHILAIAKELDKIRVDWQAPVIVTSWFRPSPKLGYPFDVNRECGGVSDSQHIYGRAVDICPVNPADIHDFQAWLERSWFGYLGRGAYRGFVHLDMRNGKGWKATGPKGDRFSY